MKTLRLISAVSTLATILTGLAVYDAQANTKIENAEQAVVIATCKLNWLRQGGGKTNSKEYFGFMFNCLPK